MKRSLFVPGWWLCVVASLWFGAALAEETEAGRSWTMDWDGTVYGYAAHTSPRGDSILNPGNQVAQLARDTSTVQGRLNVKAENDLVRFTARSIISTARNVVVLQENNGQNNTLNTTQNNPQNTLQRGQQADDAYLSQWQLQLHAAEGINLAVGREVLNWGAGQFRSPSSPFYFDNGRNDPMRELIGMDDAKLVWTPDMQHSLTLAYILDTGHFAASAPGQTDPWRASWLAKFDQRGVDWSASAIAVGAPGLPVFLGVNGQLALNDALMLYGEAGSSAQSMALYSASDTSQPLTLQTPAARKSGSLLGLAYTFMNGSVVNSEYLHDERGYTAAQERAYFQRAPGQPGMALSFAPPLLGRDYLNLVWQSNVLENSGYSRVMLAHSLTDGGNQLAYYGETSLTGKLSLFALGVWNSGTARQEFSALFGSSMSIGLKLAIP